MVEDAEIILVSYGISSRIAKSAVDTARQEGLKVGLFRPISLYPFPKDRLKELADRNDINTRFISVEMSNGQMMEDVKLAIECNKPVSLVNSMGGELMDIEKIIS
jgi:2-oxoisovalerate ferredoxin oxidoreductase alpha subunit